MTAVVGISRSPKGVMRFHHHLLSDADSSQDWSVPLMTRPDEADDGQNQIYVAGHGTYVVYLYDSENVEDYTFIVRGGKRCLQSPPPLLHGGKNGSKPKATKMKGHRKPLAQHGLVSELFLMGNYRSSDSEDGALEASIEVMWIGDTTQTLYRTVDSDLEEIYEGQFPIKYPFEPSSIKITNVYPEGDAGEGEHKANTLAWTEGELPTRILPGTSLEMIDEMYGVESIFSGTPVYTHFGWFMLHTDAPMRVKDDPIVPRPRAVSFRGFVPGTDKDLWSLPKTTAHLSPLGYMVENDDLSLHAVDSTGHKSAPFSLSNLPIVEWTIDTHDVWLNKPEELVTTMSDAMTTNMAGYVLDFYFPSLF